MTVSERVELNVLQKLFANELRGTWMSALDNAAGANDALSSAMQATRKEAEDAAGYFLGAETLGLLNGDLTMDPAAFFERGSVAIAALYKLSGFVGATARWRCLQTRIERSKANRDTILIGTGLVLLLVLYFFAGMLFSVLRSLKSIRAGAERLARGDLSKSVDSHSKDELREVGRAVNSVAQTLQAFTKAQLDMARAHTMKAASARTSTQMTFRASMATWRGT